MMTIPNGVISALVLKSRILLFGSANRMPGEAFRAGAAIPARHGLTSLIRRDLRSELLRVLSNRQRGVAVKDARRFAWLIGLLAAVRQLSTARRGEHL